MHRLSRVTVNDNMILSKLVILKYVTIVWSWKKAWRYTHPTKAYILPLHKTHPTKAYILPLHKTHPTKAYILPLHKTHPTKAYILPLHKMVGVQIPAMTNLEVFGSRCNLAIFYYLHLKRVMTFIWTNRNSLHPRMFCAKFSWNWCSGSGEVV